jgi:hypothetical protein
MKTQTIKRWMSAFTVLAALAGSGFAATPAFAAERAAEMAQTSVATVSAEGRGVALFEGNGTITITGNGVLRIRDIAGDARITITGNGRRKASNDKGWLRYAGFRGSATITGTNVIVALTGAGIKLNASGSGRYLLRGTGTATVTVGGASTTSGWSGAQWRQL